MKTQIKPKLSVFIPLQEKALSASLGVFCITVALFFIACKGENKETPSWETVAVTQEKKHSFTDDLSSNHTVLDTKNSAEKNAALKSSKDKDQLKSKPEQTVFIVYNLKNYLQMWRSVNGKRRITGKPEKEVQQLVDLIAKHRPAILGVCEIGKQKDLEDLQQRLKKAGVDLPYTHLTGGSDEVRHLALLSVFPIRANPTPNLGFQLNGQDYKVQRGILDAYVETPIGDVRFLGVHFKSKREVREFSQAAMRKKEALVLRKHLTSIHANKETAKEKVIVYGDFNDYTRTTAVRKVIGARNTKAYCRPINLKDKYGLNWTHFWSYQEVYSRLDYVLANKIMYPLIQQEQSKIIDVSDFPLASDHRPLKIVF